MIALSLASGLGAAEPTSTQPTVNKDTKMDKESSTPTLPFAWDVTTRKHAWMENADYPMNLLVNIDHEVWLMHVPNDDVYKSRCLVHRYKGPDLEHLERQPDGFAARLTAGGENDSAAFLCGMWWDETSRVLYGLIHSEYGGTGKAGWCSKKTKLATSKDLGLTWTLVGDILTRALPSTRDYAGAFFEPGPADFDFYADVRGGYFYLTCWNGFTPKEGTFNAFPFHSEVARCAIADKMVPGKWFKFRDGAWTEPGLGGKASRVGCSLRGIYGSTIYSTYLKKYLRIGTAVGVVDPRFKSRGFNDNSLCISTCSDLTKQDWSPMARLLDEPKNDRFGTTLTDANGVDSVTCGRELRVYNFWQNAMPSRVLDISLKEGSTPTKYFPPHDSYEYESHPQSGDRIESRKTKIVGATAPEIQYAGGGWTAEKNDNYYQGQAMTAAKAEQSVQFEFQGSDIYWRAAAGPDAGKADVFIDGALEKTVDLYFQECALPYQFAFIKTGLDPKKSHTIKVVVRGDKNPGSSGTTIRHIAFEHAVELDMCVQLAFRDDDIYLYWKPVAGIDQGVADVFIDNVFETTVDLLFKDKRALPYEFALIKSGLDPKKPHTIKVVIRGGDKNPGSSGTTIRHIAAFEHPVGADMSGIMPLSGEWLSRLTNRLEPLPNNGMLPDPGISAVAQPLLAADAPETGFEKVRAGRFWLAYGGDWQRADGEAVFRKAVNIPEAWNGKALTLHLGPVCSFESTYFNGVKLGSVDTTTIPNDAMTRPLVYTIPAELVKSGRAVIAVRVFSHKGKGGLLGAEKQYILELPGQK